MPHCGKETEETREAKADDNWTFIMFQEAYPPRMGGQRWPAARKAFDRLTRKQGVDTKTLISKALAYNHYCQKTEKLRTPYVMQAATWLGDGGGYLEDWARLSLTETRFDTARRQLQETE